MDHEDPTPRPGEPDPVTDPVASRLLVDADLSGGRWTRVDLRGVVGRGVDLEGADLDSPWLADGGPVLINGVDVVGLVEAELDRRFPGRALRRARALEGPDGLRAAWAAVEAAWADLGRRADALPLTALAESVDGEWSFTQTLRHLVMATDVWLGRGIRGLGDEAYHPLGLPNAEFATDGYDLSVFVTHPPAHADVLAARADRQRQVREFLAEADEADLEQERRNPWAPSHPETVRSCLHVILQEEWQHLRYAARDLAVVAAALEAGSGQVDDAVGQHG
ncbi:DinB family protein [Nocardioides sp.]|uniref:DinB family protein n=1 Tax=Nocardioides sp. TaxID=35761 RepID=UPI003511DE04